MKDTVEPKNKRRIRKLRKTKARRRTRNQKMSVNKDPKQNGCSVMPSLHPLFGSKKDEHSAMKMYRGVEV